MVSPFSRSHGFISSATWPFACQAIVRGVCVAAIGVSWFPHLSHIFMKPALQYGAVSLKGFLVQL